MTARVTAVVPTLGASPLLGACLSALRADGGDLLKIVVVRQASTVEIAPGLADRILDLPRNVGFAAATNQGADLVETEFFATVNDDVVVASGWLSSLLAALDAHPEAAAAQGVNLIWPEAATVDGCGIGWNRRFEAVQLGRGGPPPAADEKVREIFGVSATAALYRVSALEPDRRSNPSPGTWPFAVRLGSYYEDVELAIRLRSRGEAALLVPAARAAHAGSVTGASLGSRRWAFIYGNRLLVLARLLGARFWPLLPGLAVRDFLAATRGLVRGEPRLALGVALGWARVVRSLPGFAHFGSPRLSLAELERFGFGKAS